jgi:hypothetical protein
MLLICAAGGCGQSGPQVAPVKGRVTLDGQPLPNVAVQFQPDEGKRPSGGGTDENGEYQLYYKRGVIGAQLGPHVVQILAPVEPKAPIIPVRYNKQSELRAEVKAGPNEINFDLKSDAK